MFEYYIFNKPYGVICQFSKQDNKPTLADYLTVKKDVYPVGRLDTDSEGLLILTNDKSMNKRLLDPSNAHKRVYHVQVDGDINSDALQKLTNGVEINVDGQFYKTKKCKAKKIDQPSYIWERNPPIRKRKLIPVSWIEIELTEGKNRQVRKMTAAVGFPTLRLIRYSMGKLNIETLQPGSFIAINKSELLD